MQIRKANPNKPVRVMLYGVEGVGKSTFGSKSDKPIFISAEGGTDQLTDINNEPVHEMAGISTWDNLRKSIQQLLVEPHEYKTVVIDSADWIEQLCHAKIILGSNKSIITCNGGYGAGYRQSQNMHKELIDDLNNLREQKGMNIIVTAHAHVKAVKDPALMEDYDGFEPKCHEFVSSLWREWVDALFFVRFKTYVKASDDMAKARAIGDGTRVIYTVKQPAFQAKNRYGMPSELTFTENFWVEFMKYAKKGVLQESEADLKAECLEMISKLTDGELKEKALSSVNATWENADGSISGPDLKQLQSMRKRLKEIRGDK